MRIKPPMHRKGRRTNRTIAVFAGDNGYKVTYDGGSMNSFMSPPAFTSGIDPRRQLDRDPKKFGKLPATLTTEKPRLPHHSKPAKTQWNRLVSAIFIPGGRRGFRLDRRQPLFASPSFIATK